MIWATLNNDTIDFEQYPFKPALVYPDKTISAADIDAVCLKGFPPVLKMDNELIFIAK